MFNTNFKNKKKSKLYNKWKICILIYVQTIRSLSALAVALCGFRSRNLSSDLCVVDCKRLSNDVERNLSNAISDNIVFVRFWISILRRSYCSYKWWIFWISVENRNTWILLMVHCICDRFDIMSPCSMLLYFGDDQWN